MSHLLGPRAARPSWLPHEYAVLSDADALQRLAPGIPRHDVYVCGPDPWAAAVRAAAAAAGVPDSPMRRITLWLLSTVARRGS